MTASPPRETDDHADVLFLVYLGTAMVATGQTVHEIEADLRAVGAHLGHRDLQVAAGPTGITLSLHTGAPATYESVNGPLRLDQAAAVRTIRHQLLSAEIDVHTAAAQLLMLRDKPARYPTWMANVGFVLVATGIALILQPGPANVLAAAIGGVIVVTLMRVSQRHDTLAALLPTVAAFVVSCLVFGAAQVGLLDGSLRTVLPPLAVLLPGALMVTGLSELAAGDMMAGSARLIFGGVQLLLFALGLVAAAALLRTPTILLANVRVAELGWWAAPLGLLMIVVGICWLESVPPRLLPWVLAVLVLAFSAQLGGQQLGSAALGSFLGAIAASLGASLAEAFRPQLPRLVVFLPAFWLLVPGSLGLLGVTQIAIAPSTASSGIGFGVLSLVGAIALGLLVGSAVARTGGQVQRWAHHRRVRRGS
ncbi:MAG: threonine/serine ThrE exporter family protein [Propionibacteriaceae bacterium]